jgi:hypothetical protein
MCFFTSVSALGHSCRLRDTNAYEKEDDLIGARASVSDAVHGCVVRSALELAKGEYAIT